MEWLGCNVKERVLKRDGLEMGYRWRWGNRFYQLQEGFGKEGNWYKDVEVASKEGEEMEVGDMGGKVSCVW
jgi:hypothetical protein